MWTESWKCVLTVYLLLLNEEYKVVQIWPVLIVYKQVTVCPGHIWTTLYVKSKWKTKYPLKIYLINKFHTKPTSLISNLSYDRSTASSKTIPPLNAI
jgi:hypothetical protein